MGVMAPILKLLEFGLFFYFLSSLFPGAAGVGARRSLMSLSAPILDLLEFGLVVLLVAGKYWQRW